jgi:hypothetical protein
MSLLTNKGSVFDLAATYIMLFKDSSIDSQQKRQVALDMACVLKAGWTFKEITNELHRRMRTVPKTIPENIVSFFLQYLRRNKGANDTNVLDPTRFYYHKELKIMNGPKRVDVDYNAGTMVSSNQEYFLEIAASYTFNELADYFVSKDMIDTNVFPRNRIVGIMKYYVDRYGLDETLFMIEAANEYRLSENRYLSNITEFDNYYVTAKEFIETVKTNCKYSGGDKVVPKRRVLFG